MNNTSDEETATTALITEHHYEDSASTSLPSFRLGRPGRFLAGIVLTAALSNPWAWHIPDTPYTGRRREDGVVDSVTEKEAVDPTLVLAVRDLFERAASEFFIDGIESDFSRGLIRLITEHGRSAFQAIAKYLYSGYGNPDVVSEALRWLAEIGDEWTLPDRWTILQTMLRDSSPRVRDGAILGFAVLDDPRTRDILFKARDAEQVVELRRLINQVIAQLDATSHGAASDRSS